MNNFIRQTKNFHELASCLINTDFSGRLNLVNVTHQTEPIAIQSEGRYKIHRMKYLFIWSLNRPISLLQLRELQTAIFKSQSNIWLNANTPEEYGCNIYRIRYLRVSATFALMRTQLKKWLLYLQTAIFKSQCNIWLNANTMKNMAALRQLNGRVDST